MTVRTRQQQNASGSEAIETSVCEQAAGTQLPLGLSDDDIAVIAQTFQLLGDPSRLRILLQCMRGATCVGDIAQNLGLSQSLVSHHLRTLRDARLVRGERRARQVFYDIADHHVAHVLRDMAVHILEEHTEEQR